MARETKRFFTLLLFTALSASCFSSPVVADDDVKTSAPVSTGAAKVDAPAPMTERERMLLDRIEELEKRMAQMEAQSHASSNATKEAVSPATAATVSSAAVVNATPPANEHADATTALTAGTQPATQASAAGKPKKSEPFAFADFTWLTGNARTKES